MAEPQTREQFADYCLRRLGAPEIDVNVTSDQIEDRIDDALAYYRDYHYDGQTKYLMRHQITEEDIANKYITIPDSIAGITGIYPLSGNLYSSTNYLFDIRYHFIASNMSDVTSFSIIPWHMAMERIEMINRYFSTTPSINWNRHTDRLYINAAWGTQLVLGQYLLIQCYKDIDPEEFPGVWKDRWLKRYATQLIKRQWGENLKKFTGVKILDGIALDGQKIWDEADQEITKLEESMINDYGGPLNEFVG